ncbi:MAG TPA: tetratricopeptide repeat protein [Rhodocyclaceae bacterium]|jgi:tetratricopeptide (TPR) repeat protein|nr:tetratricopeptide repeat protein [Rhodocyclaceae bacterium]
MKILLFVCTMLPISFSHAVDAQNPLVGNATTIRVTHRITPTMGLLEQGYAALRQNFLSQASRLYAQVLIIDSKNTDALCGLAIIALRENRPDIAERHYRQILALDPRNANAVAALSDLRAHFDETRLKLLLAEMPDNAALHFALGNLYARTQRWPEAQQAWFRAYTNDTTNPDIIFNLAVGLDHIGQANLAAQYYAEALRVADTNYSSFIRTVVQTRLKNLGAD